MEDHTMRSGSEDKANWPLLAIGLVLAAAVAVTSFVVTVAPAGLDGDPENGATFKKVSSPPVVAKPTAN